MSLFQANPTLARVVGSAERCIRIEIETSRVSRLLDAPTHEVLACLEDVSLAFCGEIDKDKLQWQEA